MKTPADIPPVHLSSEQRRNIFFAVKEALHNVVKHAEATEAEIIVTYNDQIVSVDIRDNGVGIHSGERNRFGNGIIQMEKRMHSIGGRFEIENNHGTRIKLSLTVSEK
jgi:signal transduction histidine kinase